MKHQLIHVLSKYSYSSNGAYIYISHYKTVFNLRKVAMLPIRQAYLRPKKSLWGCATGLGESRGWWKIWGFQGLSHCHGNPGRFGFYFSQSVFFGVLQAIQVLQLCNSGIFLDCWTLYATDCRFSSLFFSTKSCQLFLYLLTKDSCLDLFFLFPRFFQLLICTAIFSRCW